MRGSLIGWIVCFLVLAPAVVVSAADAQWELPRVTPEGFLPKLGAITVDGDPGEWGAAAAVPLRFASYIAYRAPSHAWKGPTDCGMEVLCGWNDAGLCLAGIVADDDVQNNATPENSYYQDCLELFVDGRVGGAFMRPPYSRGAYQLFVRPPDGGKATALYFAPGQGVIEGYRVAGRLVAGGWTFELILPWSAFPGFTPCAGANFGLQFGLDDYDARDGATNQPLMMTWQGTTLLFLSPHKFVKWTLVDAFPKGAGTPLGTVAGIDMPAETYEGASVKAAIELGRSITGQAASGTYEVKDWTGTVAAQGPITLAKLPPPWQLSAGGGFEWTLGNTPDGVYAVEVTFRDARGAPLGVSRRSVMLLRYTWQEGKAAIADAITRIEKADIPRLAQTDPLRAAAWMSVAACVEKLKWAYEKRNRQLVQLAPREMAARLAVLETGALPKECPAPYDLLALTADPAGQVVVEYAAMGDATARSLATVTFSWAGLPLVSAMVWDYPDAETARKSFASEGGRWWSKSVHREMKLTGLPAQSSQDSFSLIPFALGKFDPARQVLVCSPERNYAIAVDVTELDNLQADTVTISPSTPAPVKKAVQRWARKARTPIEDFPRAMTRSWCILAGLPAGDKDVQQLRRIPEIYKAIRDIRSSTYVLDGSWILYFNGTADEVVGVAARLISARKPVTAADADAVRQVILRSVPKPQAPVPAADMNLYNGDLHVHSDYSDGSSTPVGMALEAIYCGMDFLALTDHNTLDGAQVAGKLFRACGIDFPIVPGEEITTSWAHLNAYPLREVVPENLPPYETIKAVHRQGAVIQWNHPGAFDLAWYLAHGEEAMRGTGLDAWEHTLPQYAQWKREGRLPTLIGSSDTHDATFGISERTLILASSPAGDDVAEAVRRNAVLLVNSSDPRLFLGPDEMIACTLSALADGQAMLKQRTARLTAALSKADIPALLRKSPATVVKPGDVGP